MRLQLHGRTSDIHLQIHYNTLTYDVDELYCILMLCLKLKQLGFTKMYSLLKEEKNLSAVSL